MSKKRLVAYIIDTIIITILVGITLTFIPISNEAKKIQTKIDEIGEKYASNEMDEVNYFMELSTLKKDLDNKKALEIVIDSIFIVIYYIIVPFITNGKTIGRIIMKIKIKSNNKRVNLMSLFVRCFLMDGLLVSILIIFGIYLIPKDFYLTFTSILLILQILALIVTYFMIKYRRDCLGLDDILSKSIVVNE